MWIHSDMLMWNMADSAESAAYSNTVLTLYGEYETVIAVNGTGSGQLIISNKNTAYTAGIKIYTCTGELVKNYEGEIDKGLNLFEVPVSGMIEILRGEANE